jgi:hypothetical protein
MLERFVHLAVELDLVVKVAEDLRDAPLFGERRERDYQICELIT